MTMFVVAACTATAAPANTPVPEPTATPTAVPVQTISIDPRRDPEAFLAALPRAEVDCASSAVGGSDNLIDLVSFSEEPLDDVSDTQLKVLASCISGDTVEKVLMGQLDLSIGGLSASSSACIAEHTDGIDFSTLFTGYAVEAEAIASTLQALFCLTPGERDALESSDQEFAGIVELGGIDALECAIDGMGPAGIGSFADMFNEDGTVNTTAVGQFMPLMIDCGVVDDDLFVDTGLGADQFACLFEHIDEATLNELLDVSANPGSMPDLSSAANVLTAISECGIDIQSLLDSADEIMPEDPGTALPPIVSTDLLICLTDNGVSPSLAAAYAGGIADTSDAGLAAALAACDGGGSGSGVVVPGDGGTTIDPSVLEGLPITVEQAQCLVNEIGEEQLAGIADGSTSPLSALNALGACSISISDLLLG